MLFFLFRKNYLIFLFNKNFIINYKKNRKINHLNSENKLFLIKNQKNKYHLSQGKRTDKEDAKERRERENQLLSFYFF